MRVPLSCSCIGMIVRLTDCAQVDVLGLPSLPEKSIENEESWYQLHDAKVANQKIAAFGIFVGHRSRMALLGVKPRVNHLCWKPPRFRPVLIPDLQCLVLRNIEYLSSQWINNPDRSLQNFRRRRSFQATIVQKIANLIPLSVFYCDDGPRYESGHSKLIFASSVEATPTNQTDRCATGGPSAGHRPIHRHQHRLFNRLA